MQIIMRLRKNMIVYAMILCAFMFNGCSTAASSETSRVTKSSAKGTGESLSKFNQNTADIIHAEIISVDVEDKKVKVKDTVTGNQLEIKVADPSTLPSFVTGDKVRITFPSSDRTTATNVVAEEQEEPNEN